MSLNPHPLELSFHEQKIGGGGFASPVSSNCCLCHVSLNDASHHVLRFEAQGVDVLELFLAEGDFDGDVALITGRGSWMFVHWNCLLMVGG